MNKNLCSVTSKPAQSSNRQVSSFSVTKYYRDELHKSEVLLTANKLLLVKAENIYRNAAKIPWIQWKQSLAIEQFLETLFFAITICTRFITDVIWINSKVCNVTNEASQSNGWRVPSFKGSSWLVNIYGVNFTKSGAILIASTLFVVKAKNKS